jgi:Nitrile hydratase, alpha chain/Nitrile hydratase beta subunit
MNGIHDLGGMHGFGPIEREPNALDSSAEIRYMVLPLRSKGMKRLSDAERAALVTRDTMFGVAYRQALEAAR